MSKISTKRGDDGFSDLRGAGRVRKSHVIYAALGDLDELNAFIGVARALLKARNEKETDAKLEWVQQELIKGMGDVASLLNTDGDKKSWHFSEEALEKLEAWGNEHESFAMESASLRGWALPGATGSLIAAQWDVARTVCRRAERSVFAVLEVLPQSPTLKGWIFPKFLNRLSDVLWIEARRFEATL